MILSFKGLVHPLILKAQFHPLSPIMTIIGPYVAFTLEGEP